MLSKGSLECAGKGGSDIGEYLKEASDEGKLGRLQVTEAMTMTASHHEDSSSKQRPDLKFQFPPPLSRLGETAPVANRLVLLTYAQPVKSAVWKGPCGGKGGHYVGRAGSATPATGISGEGGKLGNVHGGATDDEASQTRGQRGLWTSACSPIIPSFPLLAS